MIRKGYVDTADGQIHYRYCSGGKGSPLVFLHMTAASSGAYEGMMAELDGQIPMFALDTVNYGESYRTKKPPSMSYIADVTLEAMANLGAEKFHAFGHHTGASTCVEMAGKRPDRLLSNILNGPTYASMEELSYFKDRLATPSPISIKGSQFLLAWSRAKDNFPTSLMGDAPKQAEILNREAIDQLRAGEDWCWAYRAVFSHDLPAAMKKVRCPIFFVSGAQDLSYPLHRRAVEAYPDARCYEHPEGGVFYNETHPEDLAPHLLDFIRSVEPL